MTGNVTTLPNAGSGAALGGGAATYMLGVPTNLAIAVAFFGLLLMALTLFNLGKVQCNSWRLRRAGRLD